MRGYIYQSGLTSRQSVTGGETSQSWQGSPSEASAWRSPSEREQVDFQFLKLILTSMLRYKRSNKHSQKNQLIYTPFAPDATKSNLKVCLGFVIGSRWLSLENLAFNWRTHCFKCRCLQWWNWDVPFNGLTGCVDIETYWSLCQRGGCPGRNSTALWSEKENKSSSHDNVARGETPNTGCWLVCLLLYWFQTGMGSSPNKASGPVLSRQRSIN